MPMSTRIWLARSSSAAGVGSSARAARRCDTPATRAQRRSASALSVRGRRSWSQSPVRLRRSVERRQGFRRPSGPARIAALARPRTVRARRRRACAASARGERLGIGDRAEGAIENVVAAVGDENVASRRRRTIGPRKPERRAGALDTAARRAEAERDDFDRQRKRAEPRDAFRRSAITSMRFDDAATIFSRSSAPPPPLIRLSVGVDFVGAVDRQIEFGHSSSVVSGMPSASRLAARRLRGRHADDVEARSHARAERVDEHAARSSRCPARASCPGARTPARVRRLAACRFRLSRQRPSSALQGRGRGLNAAGSRAPRAGLAARRRKANRAREPAAYSAPAPPRARPRTSAGPCAAH